MLLAVELQSAMAHVQDSCGVVVDRRDELGREPVGGRWHDVEHVDGDAEARGLRDGGGQKSDRSADGGVPVAFAQLLAAAVCLVVMGGELFVAPRGGELLVGGLEVEHRSLGA